MDRLDEIEQRLANATPGPWEVDADGDIQGRRRGMHPDPELDPIVTSSAERQEDTDLIAHAPADLAALVAVVREVAALHQSRPNSTSALYPKPLCTCGVVWENCPTAAAVQKLGEGS